MKCQSCDNTNLNHILSLGPLPPCNDMRPVTEPAKAQEWLPTDLLYCPQCELVQLEYIGDPRVVFPASYPYTSGSTKMLRDNFADLAREAINILSLKPDPLNDGPEIVDIGSNDGTLLSNFKSRGFNVFGIEPTDVAFIAMNNGIRTHNAFFNSDVARDTSIIEAKLITCCNCFAHMKDVHDVLEGVDEMLADNGVFVTESHYLIDLIDKLQYDTIYHEHLRYYSFVSLRNLLEQHGLHIFHAKKIPTHGGSIRVYAHRVPPPDIVGNSLIEKSLFDEPTGDEMISKLKDFAGDVVQSKLHLMETMASIQGSHICGISAPSRASTVINYCRLDDALIDYVVEIEGSLKIGKYMPGTNIPVIEEAILFGEYQPKYAVLFSWHLADELIPKLKAKGFDGAFIMPCARTVTMPLAMRAGSRS